MNTPYPELRVDLTQRLRDFADWNKAVERSKQEYRLNPTASCGVTDCERLRAAGRMCSSHAGPNVRRLSA